MIPRNSTINVNYELTMTFTIFSVLIFLFIGFGICWLFLRRPTFIDRKWDAAILSLAIFVSLLQMLSYKLGHELNVINDVARIFMETFGIVAFVFGSYAFFKEAGQLDPIPPLNHRHRSVANFVLIMVVLLAVLNSILVMGALMRGKSLSVAGIVLALLQKVIQAGIYRFSLQFKTPYQDRCVGASWFFKLFSLFNFLMFLNDLINLSTENDESFKKILAILGDFSKAYNLLSVTYDSLVADYRLLLVFFFLEHAIMIDHHISNHRDDNANSEHEEDQNDANNGNEEDQPNHPQIRLSEYRWLGYFLGGILFLLQIGNVLQYVSKTFSWTNSFAISADWCLIICATMLLYNVGNRLPNNTLENESSGVELLMIMMGVFSMLYWAFRSVTVLTWANQIKADDNLLYSYLIWNGVKYISRTISSVFQIWVLLSITHNVIFCRDITSRRLFHVLIAFQWFTFLSVYLSSVVGAYAGDIEQFLQSPDSDTQASIAFIILYQAGGPIHLGFAMHVFLNFFVILNNIGARENDNIHPGENDVAEYDNDGNH